MKTAAWRRFTETKPLLRLFLGILALCVMVAGLFYWKETDLTRSGHFEEIRTKSQQRTAPGFELKDSAGHLFRVTDFRGNWVVVHFWASWCPPCLGEIPQWVELGRFFQSRPVKWITISQDQNWADAQKILPEKVLLPNMISLLDPPGQVSDLYGTYQFPETYFINPEGKIVMKLVGPQEWDRGDVRAGINKLFGFNRE